MEKHHWPLDDPARAEGSEEEIMLSFRLIAILVMGLLINKIATVEEKEAVYKLHAS